MSLATAFGPEPKYRVGLLRIDGHPPYGVCAPARMSRCRYWMAETNRRRRSFSPEFKREIVALCQLPDNTVASVCKEYDPGETAVRRWVHQTEVDAGVKPGTTSAERRSSPGSQGTAATSPRSPRRMATPPRRANCSICPPDRVDPMGQSVSLKDPTGTFRLDPTWRLSSSG
jgi:transposase-like protein